MKLAFIYIALGVIVLLIMAMFIGQQRGKTETTIFGTIWNKFFPNKMESVVIPGTTAGGGCPTIDADKPEIIAQAVLDCWKQGETYKRDIRCCYFINPEPMNRVFDKKEIQDILKLKPGGVVPAGQIVWNNLLVVQSIKGYSLFYIAPFTICLDYDWLTRNEVYFTMTPEKDC